MTHEWETGKFEMGERQRRTTNIHIILEIIAGGSLIAWTYWFLHHIPGVK